MSIDLSIVTMEDSNVQVPSSRVPKGTILALFAFSIQWHTAGMNRGKGGSTGKHAGRNGPMQFTAGQCGDCL